MKLTYWSYIPLFLAYFWRFIMLMWLFALIFICISAVVFSVLSVFIDNAGDKWIEKIDAKRNAA